MKRAWTLAALLGLGLAHAGCGPKCKDTTPDNLNLGMTHYDDTGWPILWEGQKDCRTYTFCQPGFGVVQGCYFRSQPIPVTAGTTYRLEITLNSPKGALVRFEWLDANGQQLGTSDTTLKQDTFDNAYADPAKAPEGAASTRIFLQASQGAACFAGVSFLTCQ